MRGSVSAPRSLSELDDDRDEHHRRGRHDDPLLFHRRPAQALLPVATELTAGKAKGNAGISAMSGARSSR